LEREKLEEELVVYDLLLQVGEWYQDPVLRAFVAVLGQELSLGVLLAAEIVE